MGCAKTPTTTAASKECILIAVENLLISKRGNERGNSSATGMVVFEKRLLHMSLSTGIRFSDRFVRVGIS